MSYLHNPTAHSAAAYGPGTLPHLGSWTEVDISSIVGSAAVWVLVKVYNTGSQEGYFVRPGDSSSDWKDQQTYASGSNSVTVPSNESGLVIITTDSSGCFDITTSFGSNTTTLFVLGHVPLTLDTTELMASGQTPLSWTSLSTDSIVGEQLSLVVVNSTYTGGAGTRRTWAMRPTGETSDWLVKGIYYSTGGGPNCFGAYPCDYQAACITDSSGDLEHIGEQDGSPRTDSLAMAGYAALETPTNPVVFAAAAPPASFTDIDLTVSPDGDGNTGMVAARNFVILKLVKLSTASRFAVRAKDDSGVYQISHDSNGAAGCELYPPTYGGTTVLMCETDSSGVVQFRSSTTTGTVEVSLLGYIRGNVGPVISDGTPTGEQITSTFPVSFDMADSNGIDIDTLNVSYIPPAGGSIDVLLNGAWQSGYGGTLPANEATSGTVVISTHPGFPPAGDGAYDFSASCADLLGTVSDVFEWTFDNVPGVVRNRVYNVLDDSFVWWETSSSDTTGVSYPGSGQFGQDTFDFCIERELSTIVTYRNRVFDPLDGWVRWDTNSGPDSTGTSYPGSSGWESVSDFCVERVVR